MEIKSMSKSQIAELYAPEASLKASLRRLQRWIERNDELNVALKETGYQSSQRIFTKRQVEIIFEYLGEP